MPVDRPTMLCLDCGYVLDGLPEQRCPECGTTFVTSDRTTFRRAQTPSQWERWRTVGLRVTRPIVIIPASWAASLMCIASVLIVPLLVAGLGANLARRKWVAASLIILLSPLSVWSLKGGFDYVTGSARLRTMGLPSLRSHNIDPVYRCGRSSGGCLVDGDEWVSIVPYNATVKFLITAFGPMNGAYLGPIPSEAQAIAMLKGASEISPNALAEDRVDLDGSILNLDRRVGVRLLRGSSLWDDTWVDPDQLAQACNFAGPITAARYARQCLILRIPTGGLPNYTGEPEQSAIIVTIDVHSGRPFGYYGQGQSYLSYPPVRWQRDDRHD